MSDFQFNLQSRRGYRAHYVPLYENTGLCDRDWAAPLGSSGRIPECCPDKIHPTDIGYSRIATEFGDRMTAVLFPEEESERP